MPDRSWPEEEPDRARLIRMAENGELEYGEPIKVETSVEPIEIRLPAVYHRKLTALARERCLSVSSCARMVLIDFFSAESESP